MSTTTNRDVPAASKGSLQSLNLGVFSLDQLALIVNWGNSSDYTPPQCSPWVRIDLGDSESAADIEPSAGQTAAPARRSAPQRAPASRPVSKSEGQTEKEASLGEEVSADTSPELASNTNESESTLESSEATDQTQDGSSYLFYEVEISGKKLEWDSTCNNLMELAEANDIEIDSVCRDGDCGTCLMRLREGKVTYPHEPGCEFNDDQVVMCIAEPISNVRIDATKSTGKPANTDADDNTAASAAAVDEPTAVAEETVPEAKSASPPTAVEEETSTDDIRDRAQPAAQSAARPAPVAGQPQQRRGRPNVSMTTLSARTAKMSQESQPQSSMSDDYLGRLESLVLDLNVQLARVNSDDGEGGELDPTQWLSQRVIDLSLENMRLHEQLQNAK